MRTSKARSYIPAVAAALLLLVQSGALNSQETAASFAPGPYPDRMILTWSADPSTTMSVTWRTDTSVSRAWAEIAEADDGPDFPKKARRVEASSQRYETKAGPAHAHSVTFTGLQPGAAYLYRVGDGKHWSEWNQFRTASPAGEPLTFLYLGDVQTEIYSLWSRVIRRAFATAPEARFIVYAGDLINNNDRDEQWAEFHAAAGFIHRMIPVLAAPGNHEYSLTERRISPNWRPQFTFPPNGPSGLEETCYWLDIQGLRLVVLNSVEKHKEQAEWLEKVLAGNESRWTIAVFHHPIYSSARGRDNKVLRELWQPIFDKYGVDLVLQGHDHTYARTRPMRATGAVNGGGTVYVNSVSGAKMYELDRSGVFARVAQQTQLFQVIRIEGNRLRFEARTASGQLYDAFELQKRARGAREFRDLAPRTPPRLGKAA
ncbi:MAG: fibronectin type III domain-containing protein [Bryobacteraceae bacterium]